MISLKKILEAKISSKEIFKLEKEYKKGARKLANDVGIKEDAIWPLIYRTIKYNFNSVKVVDGIKTKISDEKRDLLEQELVLLAKLKVEIDKLWKKHGPLQQPQGSLGKYF